MAEHKPNIAHLPLIHKGLWLGSRSAINDMGPSGKLSHIEASMCVARRTTCDYDEDACPFTDTNLCTVVNAKDNTRQSTGDVEQFTADAASQIHELLTTGVRNLLVHCSAGRNRSSASVVRYAMTHNGQHPRKVIEYLKEMNFKHRGMDHRKTLSNPLFQQALLDMWAKSPYPALSVGDISDLRPADVLRVFRVARHPLSRLGCSERCTRTSHHSYGGAHEGRSFN
jgi:protein-tyrosine phosphatase